MSSEPLSSDELDRLGDSFEEAVAASGLTEPGALAPVPIAPMRRLLDEIRSSREAIRALGEELERQTAERSALEKSVRDSRSAQAGRIAELDQRVAAANARTESAIAATVAVARSATEAKEEASQALEEAQRLRRDLSRARRSERTVRERLEGVRVELAEAAERGSELEERMKILRSESTSSQAEALGEMEERIDTLVRDAVERAGRKADVVLRRELANAEGRHREEMERERERSLGEVKKVARVRDDLVIAHAEELRHVEQRVREQVEMEISQARIEAYAIGRRETEKIAEAREEGMRQEYERRLADAGDEIDRTLTKLEEERAKLVAIRAEFEASVEMFEGRIAASEAQHQRSEERITALESDLAAAETMHTEHRREKVRVEQELAERDRREERLRQEIREAGKRFAAEKKEMGELVSRLTKMTGSDAPDS